MDGKLYRKYLVEYIRAAVAGSDGSVHGVAVALDAMQIGGWWVLHKEERSRALADARQAFTEYRHWPLEMVINRLGIEL